MHGHRHPQWIRQPGRCISAAIADVTDCSIWRKQSGRIDGRTLKCTISIGGLNVNVAAIVIRLQNGAQVATAQPLAKHKVLSFAQLWGKDMFKIATLVLM